MKFQDPRLVLANSLRASLFSLELRFRPFPNKTLSHHHRKTRTAIFAYFRKRSFSAPKTHNFCQLTKTHDFHNLHHNICMSPNPESESAENTFLPRKIRHFSCWQLSAIFACFAKRKIGNSA